jgi:simple sugar transport system ATP-binding protein
VTILRDGRVIDTVETADVTRADLASMMVGEEVVLDIEKEATEMGSPVLEVTDLHVKDDRGLDAVDGVDLDIKQGEIVGIAGVSGNGQTELAESLAGLRDPTAGTITVSGTELPTAEPQAFIDHGVSFIPEDRMKYGIAEDLSVMHNLVMKDIDAFGDGPGFDYEAAREHAEALIEEFDVKVPDSETPVGKLSGGNIQKVILARELSKEPDLLIANQPTRGVDVGAIESIRNTLLDQCADGTGILLVSEELDEVLQMSDRILVIHDGEIVHEVTRENADRDRIGQYMAEGSVDDAVDGESSPTGGVAN